MNYDEKSVGMGQKYNRIHPESQGEAGFDLSLFFS
jgi:hypothetical protein